MIDQSHNLKGKIEAMVQTVVTAQELWLKAALIDREKLADPAAILRAGRRRGALPGCFLARCSPAVAAWRRGTGPGCRSAGALRESGYVERITRERASRQSAVSSYA